MSLLSSSNRLARAAIPAALIGLVTLMFSYRASSQTAGEEPLDVLMRQWENNARERIEKNDNLKALATKNTLVVLHSRHLYAKGGGYLRSAYCFFGNSVQLAFHNRQDCLADFSINTVVGQQNLAVDLGRVNFADDPDPSKIGLNHLGLISGSGRAQEGHVYLERLRDDRGMSCYVVFQIIAVDKNCRYMAFLWRKLPGGKIVND